MRARARCLPRGFLLAQAIDRAFHQFGCGEGFGRGVEDGKTETQAAAAAGIVEAHCQLHVRRADFTRHAGGARRAFDASLVEQPDQIHCLAAGE